MILASLRSTVTCGHTCVILKSSCRLQAAHAAAEGDIISLNSMLATLLIASQRLPSAAPLTATQPQVDIDSHEQVLQDIHAATKAFESLKASKQWELLQCSRIAQLITSLQWQLVHVLQLGLARSTAAETTAQVCFLEPLHCWMESLANFKNNQFSHRLFVFWLAMSRCRYLKGKCRKAEWIQVLSHLQDAAA